ncbi:MAG: PQQ-binding-like beta-propeller repeat protein [Planctomycetes bacterium]|nr:PQQ-binding-like beta-propeller repeat protein [Planctomycetota bacterium]
MKHIIAMVILSLAGSVHAGDDWPQFRGPTGQGHVTSDAELPLHWSATENVTWKQTIPGRGWSSPIVVDGKVYLTTAVQDDTGYALRTLCLDARDGKTLWDTAVFEEHKGAANIHNKNSHASPTPLLVGDKLFVHFGHMGTACLALDGRVIWRNNVLHYTPVHGNGGSPVLVGEALIFSADGANDPFVAALSAKDGHVLWRVPRSETEARKKFSFCTPLVIEVKGQTQVILPGSGAVFAYDPANGKEIWRVRYGQGYSVVPRPVFGNGMIYVSSGFDRPIVMAIRVDGHGDVTDTHVAWTVQRGGPNTPSLLLRGEELYMIADRGIATCVNALNGEEIWQNRIDGNYSASPIDAGERIYVQSEEGLGVVLKAGKQFEVLARNDLGERSLASYAVSDGSLFIRTEEHLYRIGQ